MSFKIKPLKDGFDVGSVKLEIINTPGHSKGSICLYEKANKVLFSGDTVFPQGSFGRVDLPTGNLKELVNSLEKLTSFVYLLLN